MATRLERLVAMDDMIRRGRYPDKQLLCEMFEVKERTVFEDIRYLKEEMGREIEFDRFKNGYYNKNPNKQLPAFDLSDGEVLVLTIGKEMLSQYTGTSFEPILESALEKIYGRLQDRVHINIDDLRSMVKFNTGSVIQISRKMFFDLNQACDKHLSVEIEYYTASSGETSKRRIEPYRLVENRGTWYLAAYCRLRKDRRLFALHRIKECSVQDQPFQPLPDEEIEKWLDAAVFLEHTEKEHRVKIRFSREAARYIRERHWHSSQELVEEENGGCTLSFTTPSIEETKRWILTFGPQALVLEPPELRKLVASDLEAAMQLYVAEKQKI